MPPLAITSSARHEHELNAGHDRRVATIAKASAWRDAAGASRIFDFCLPGARQLFAGVRIYLPQAVLESKTNCKTPIQDAAETNVISMY